MSVRASLCRVGTHNFIPHRLECNYIFADGRRCSNRKTWLKGVNLSLTMMGHVDAMNPPDEKWQARAKGILKAELARRHVSYRELAERLGAIGWKDNERN